MNLKDYLIRVCGAVKYLKIYSRSGVPGQITNHMVLVSKFSNKQLIQFALVIRQEIKDSYVGEYKNGTMFGKVTVTYRQNDIITKNLLYENGSVIEEQSIEQSNLNPVFYRITGRSRIPEAYSAFGKRLDLNPHVNLSYIPL